MRGGVNCLELQRGLAGDVETESVAVEGDLQLEIGAECAATDRRTPFRAWRRIECGQNEAAQSRRFRAIFSAGA
jgi:hypothetical protein